MNRLKFRRWQYGLALLILVSTGAVQGLCAHDFVAVLPGGNRIFLNITDSVKRTLEVTYEGGIRGPHTHLPKGSLEIPRIIKFQERNYTVTAIGPKAFSEAKQLERIVFPKSVNRIGAFAFEGCVSLRSVVYPSSAVEFGEDVFFRCGKLAVLAFGSDWTAIDLSPYRWSDSLKVLEIPAKVKRITHLKQVGSLEAVYVSAANPAFLSQDGLLYSKDAKTLYACPRSMRGDVVVPEGTETILEGAFTNCTKIENIDLPSTLSKVSYLEFARIGRLRSLTLRNGLPVRTAKFNGEYVFALRIPSSAVVIFVPRGSYEAYCADLCHEAGTYANIDGKQVETFPSEGFITREQIKKLK